MRSFLSSTLVLLAVSISLSGQQLGPQTLDDLEGSPAGSNVIRFLKAINATETFAAEDLPQIFAQSLIEKRGTARLLDVMADIKAHEGLIELYEAERTSTFRYELKAKGLKLDEWIDISLELEDQPPYKIKALHGLDISSIPAKTTTPMLGPGKGVEIPTFEGKVDAKKFQELDQWIQAKADQHQFSGVVLIAKDFKPLLHKAYGMASKRYQVPNTTETRFRLASISKIFTATAILRLAEQGKLSLDDKLGKYLAVEEFADPRAKEVKIRHLLNHQSGWASYWNVPDYTENRLQLRSVADYMSFIKKLPLTFDPGTKTAYSNSGYVVLGAVVEAASGMDYYEFIDQEIYKPAGMSHSGSFELDHIVENLATCYTNYDYRSERVGKDYPFENIFFSAPKGVPAGSSISTTGDLLKYLKAVVSNKVLNATSVNFLRARNGSAGKPGDFIFHNGGAPGSNTWMQCNVENGYSIIVLGNYDPPTSTKVVRHIGKVLHLQVL